MKSFKQFILEVKNNKFIGDNIDLHYRNQKLYSGNPMEIHYIRNTEKSGYFGSRFGQDIEPTGKYITPVDSIDDFKHLLNDKRFEIGKTKFNNPLILKSDENDPTVGWKKRLQNHYNKKKRLLSKAIIKDGYDGIITVNKYGPSETVDLTNFK